MRVKQYREDIVNRRRWLIWFGGFFAVVLVLALATQFVGRMTEPDGGDPTRTTVQRMIVLTRQTQTQLQSGDVSGARATGAALEQNWRTIEQGVGRRAPDQEAAVDT